MMIPEQMTLFADPPPMYGSRQRRRSRPARPKMDGRGHHENSIESHDCIERALTGRRAQIIQYVAAHGVCTDRQIVAGLFGGGDMNLVRPRVTELLKSGRLIDAGTIRDDVTGMTVRQVSTY